MSTNTEPRLRARHPGERRFARLLPAQQARRPIIDPAPPERTRRRDAIRRRVLLGADVLAAATAVGVLRAAFGHAGPGAAGLLLLVIVPLVYMAMGLYRRDELLLSTNSLDEAPTIFQAATLSAVGAFLLASALTPTPLGAQVIAVTLFSLTGATLGLRLVARTLTRRGSEPERVLLVGSREVGERFAGKLATGPAVHASLVGRIELQRDGQDGELARRVAESGAHRVVVAGEGASPERVHHAIQSAKALGVKVSVLPRMFEVVGSSVAFDYVDGMTVLGVRRFGLDRRQRVVKRTFDCVGSVLLLALLSPVMALFALAVRCTSAGPCCSARRASGATAGTSGSSSSAR